MITAHFQDAQPLVDDIDTMRQCFDLDKHHLGDRLLDNTADAILNFCKMELDSDGNPWPALGHSYKQWKDIVSPGSPIGVLFGAMLDPQEVYGTQQIAQDSAEMEYGVTSEAKKHAIRFTEGEAASGWINHQPRDFYGINPEAIRRNEDELDTHFVTIIS